MAQKLQAEGQALPEDFNSQVTTVESVIYFKQNSGERYFFFASKFNCTDNGKINFAPNHPFYSIDRSSETQNLDEIDFEPIGKQNDIESLFKAAYGRLLPSISTRPKAVFTSNVAYVASKPANNMASSQTPKGNVTKTTNNQTTVVIQKIVDKKSYVAAVLLSLIFEPIGLFYAGTIDGIIMFTSNTAFFFMSGRFSLLVQPVCHIVCIIWAIIAVAIHNSRQ